MTASWHASGSWRWKGVRGGASLDRAPSHPSVPVLFDKLSKALQIGKQGVRARAS